MSALPATPAARDAAALHARRAALVLLVIVLVGLGLRLVGITHRGLWLDEVVSLDVARHPLGEIVCGRVFDNHTPPLYYILLHLWLKGFPPSRLALRLSSVLADLATLVLLALVVGRAFGRRLGLGAAAAWAVAPFAVRLAQEGRMYSLLMLLVVGCFGLALELDRRRQSRWPAIALALTATAALYTHYYAALSLLVLHLAMAWRLRADRPAQRRWWLAMGAAGLAFVPWLPVIVRLVSSGGQPFRVFGTAVLPYAFLRFVVGFSILPITVTGKTDLRSAVLAHLPLLSVVALGAGLTLLLGVREACRRTTVEGSGGRGGEVAGPLVVALAGIPPLIALAVTMRVPSLDERYLAVSFPFVLVLGVLGVGRARRGRWWPVQGLTVLLLLAGAVAQAAAPDAGTTPWRAVAAALRRASPAGGTAVVRPGFYAPVLRGQLTDPRWQVVRGDVANAAKPSANNEGGPLETLAAAEHVEDQHPVWLVEVAFLLRRSPFQDRLWRAHEVLLLPAGNGLRLSRLELASAPAPAPATPPLQRE